MRRIGFWVIEGGRRKIEWWFEWDEQLDLDSLIERLNLISRSARCFWVEEPLPTEVREVLRRIKPSLLPKAQSLVEDILV